jgi:glutathione S-transferase
MNYDQWYRFNSAQRAHYNYVEMAPSTLVWLLISGIYFPVAAAVLGLAVIIFRLIYAIGYANGGPKGRLVGALGNDLALLGLIGLSFASSIMFTKGSSPL